MSKDDSGSGGLLAKVARFVRHPTVDWADLDRRTQGLDAERETLKAAIRRKRRNDKVRHKELDHLRAVMRLRWQAADRSTGAASSVDAHASVLPSTFHSNAVTGVDSSKSRTIEQIARIEQQMSQNWLRRRHEGDREGLRIGGGSTISPRLEQGFAPSSHLGARPAPAGVAAIPIDVVAGDFDVGAEPEAALTHHGIADAAVRFANAEYELAEQGLRVLMVQEPLSLTARMAGLALLDLLHARRHFEGFEEFAAEYAECFGVPVPRWPADADILSGADHVHCATSAVPQPSSWVCPLFLDTVAVQALSATMAEPGTTKWLDWTGLLSADLSAAQALLDEVSRWLTRPLELRFQGAAVLRRRLKASTPSGRRENEPVWWQLRLAMLRAMQRRDEFDLVALDYCVTYGVVPPEWGAPVCRFEVADGMPVALPVAQSEHAIQPLSTQMAGLEVLEWPALVTALHPSQTLFPVAHTQVSSEWPTTLPAVSGAAIRLRGFLNGDMSQAVAGLDQALGLHAPGKVFVIDCQLLDRVDFSAAGTLMQWLMGALSRGIQVELRGVSRLVAAFFHVVGIAEVVKLRLRQY